MHSLNKVKLNIKNILHVVNGINMLYRGYLFASVYPLEIPFINGYIFNLSAKCSSARVKIIFLMISLWKYYQNISQSFISVSHCKACNKMYYMYILNHIFQQMLMMVQASVYQVAVRSALTGWTTLKWPVLRRCDLMLCVFIQQIKGCERKGLSVYK